MIEVNVAIGLVGLLISILIFCVCCAEKNKDNQMKLFLTMLFLNSIVLLLDMFTWVYDGRENLKTFLYLSSTMIYLIGYMESVLFTYYLLLHIRKRKKISMVAGHVVALTYFVGVITLLVLLSRGKIFSYENKVYQEDSFFWICRLYPIVILVADMGIVFFYCKGIEKRELRSLVSYGVLPMVALLLESVIPSITLTNIAAAFAMLIIYLGVYAEQHKRLQEREMELASMRVSIMLSQIQPHFLYNALSTIQALCTKNPELARDALGDFSKYLRGNMDSISSQKPIHFSRELEHVKHYLNLEKIRFGDKMEIRYEIEEDDFFLPALTLQPIVENAVKYGIGNAEQGGVITIRTKREKKAVRIIVLDNGVGFFADSILDVPIKNDGRSHIGLNNVRNRIQKMVNGDLDLYSRENVGTVVTIIIPKG